MMFTLTQEEMDSLVPRSDLERAEKALDWMRQNFVPKCQHNPSPAPGEKPYYYCVECPLSDVGSGHLVQRPRPDREISKVMCPLLRGYPK